MCSGERERQIFFRTRTNCKGQHVVAQIIPPSESNPDMHTDKMPAPAPLRLYPTETAAKKAGLKLAEFSGERLSTTLYALLPAGEKKPTYLLSSTYRLTVAEQRWAHEHEATITKLGRFHAGGSFMPLQTNMLRKKKRE